MSLINALSHAQYGIATTERRISATAGNVANADREGYTRKTYSDSGSLGTGSVTGVIDRLLASRIHSERTTSAYHATMNNLLAQYDYSLGTTDGETGVHSALNDFLTSLSSLGISSEMGSGKASTLQDLETLTYQLRKQSSDIQALRQQADTKIAGTVDDINTLIKQVDVFNAQIGLATDSSARAELEDQRMVALESLSAKLDITYFFDSKGMATIYSSGQLLLGTSPHLLSFTPTGTISSASTYPATLSGVSLNGSDVTTSIRGGELGALIELRDKVLVNEQQALDNFAVTLMDQMNRLHNTGASIPAPQSLTGIAGFTGASALGATGTLRIATTSADGTVAGVLDIDLSLITDMNDLLIALNALPNVNATLTADGRLNIASTDPALGISLSEMDSNVTATGQGISDYLGLNDLFDTRSTSAANIYIRSDIRTNSDYFATGLLSQSPTLATGGVGIEAGDGSLAEALSELFSEPLSFTAAGGIGARSDTLVSYMQLLSSTSAQRISDASTKNTHAQAVYDGLKQQYQNRSGVNVNEEMTNVTVLQNAYSANAQVISVVKELFETLMQAIR